MADRLRTPLLLALSAVALPGCFWGDVEAGATFTVTSRNVEQYEGLLYPTSQADAWAEIFKDRPSLCPPDLDDDCDVDERERSDEAEIFLRYETSKVRGLLTQKGDLQITAHLDVGKAFAQLEERGFEDEWDYLQRDDRIWGVEGDGCTAETDPLDRTGVGQCVYDQIGADLAPYKRLSEDIRLVMLINLPGEDDVRSVECQEAPRTFASSDWSYPRPLLVNYDATGPVGEDDEQRYGGEDDEPLPQCDIEVYSRLTVATQVFAGDYFGEGDENADLVIEDGREVPGDIDDQLPGTVVLEELVLPGEDGQAHAKGRYKLAFTAQRFSEADGSVIIEGEFDTVIRNDPEQVDDPDRDIDLEPENEGGI